MPQTTTAVNACDASVWLDDENGTLTDISGSSNTINMEFTNQLGSVSNFATRWPVRLECRKDATFKLTAIYTTAQSEAKDILLNWFFNFPGNRTLKVYLPDKNVGSDVYTAEVHLATMPITVDASSADPIEISCDLMPEGAVTWVTNAT